MPYWGTDSYLQTQWVCVLFLNKNNDLPRIRKALENIDINKLEKNFIRKYL